MSSLQNRKVCFKEKGLPITYYNFHHKSLVRPKSKIEKDLNPSDTNPIFHREITCTQEITKKKQKNKTLTKISGRKLRPDLYLHSK